MRLARTTSDLFVASRAITPWWNAAAISGEYLSAASFLGIAGLQMKLGSGALWLPLGFTAGYLALLLFVAAPLRRFGAYTISDFAEARLGSPRLRVLAAWVVLGIAGFYLVPQLKGAGLTLGEVTGAPYWVGVVAVGAVVALNVAAGGMRGITYVQAFQYWTKTFAIALPACLLLIHLGGLPERAAMFGRELPRAPASGLVVELDEPQRVTFPAATTYTVDGAPGGRGGRGAHAPARRDRAAAGRRRAGGRRDRRPARRGLGAARRQLGPDLAGLRLLAAAGHLPGHDGPAAHPRPLLHEPRRAGGTAHHGQRARPARRSSTRSRSCTARSAGCSCPSSTSRASHRLRGAAIARGGVARASAASCSARWWRRARSPPSCPPRRA